MEIVVKKFGGKLLESIPHIKKIAQQIAQEAKENKNKRFVIVTSAMNNSTEKLIHMSEAITKKPNKRDYDALLACGEQTSMALFTMALSAMGCPAQSYTGFQAKILTKYRKGITDIVSIDTQALLNDLRQNKILVVAGFQGIDSEGNITTLGRGGGDLTAIALAKFLNALSCEFYKDTGGVYTIDPHFMQNNYLLPFIHYNEMLSLSISGAKLLQTDALKLAKAHNIPIHIMDCEKNQCGTIVSSKGYPQDGYFYSLVRDNTHVFAKLKENEENLGNHRDILKYVYSKNIRHKIIKNPNGVYLSILNNDQEKFKHYPLFDKYFYKDFFRKLSVISNNADTFLALIKKETSEEMLSHMEVIKGHRKNILSFFIMDCFCDEFIKNLHQQYAIDKNQSNYEDNKKYPKID